MTKAIEHLTLNDTVTYNLFFRILKDKNSFAMDNVFSCQVGIAILLSFPFTTELLI